MNTEEEKLKCLNNLLSEKKIDSTDFEKISYRSYHTDNFCYIGVRIGNSIGDQLLNGVRLRVLELVAQKFSLPFNSIDHGEIHSKSIDEKSAMELVEAMRLFESLIGNNKFIDSIIKKTENFIDKEFDKFA